MTQLIGLQTGTVVMTKLEGENNNNSSATRERSSCMAVKFGKFVDSDKS